jgi:Homeodomain-like domain
MPAMEVAARRELGRAGARQRLDERNMYRAIQHAAAAGLRQRQISEILATVSQATVQRIIQRLAANPELLRETPAEIIDSRAAGDIDSQEMMERLRNWPYSFGSVPRIDDVATDAYMAGDWDQVMSAHYRDLISDDEFAELAKLQQAQIEQAVHTR